MVLLITSILLLLAWVYYKINQSLSVWKNKGIPQSEPSILFGHSRDAVFKRGTSADMVMDIYNECHDKRYIGFYQFYRPMLMIKDPELLKQLTVKDFDNFTDHLGFLPDDDTDPLFSRNLFSLKGDKWRDMRATLSPAFTSSKMKAMFSLMADCAEEFTNNFLENASPKSFELKDTSTRFANDVIATCAFGIKCDSMKEKNNEFYSMGKKATDFSNPFLIIKFIMFLTLPKISKLLQLKFFTSDVAAFFRNLVTGAVKMREDNHIIRPDMIHLLMEARKGKLQYDESHIVSKETGFATVEESDVGKISNRKKIEITDDDMTAQALIFFFAGFDTVSTLMSFMGYELAVNPDIQNRLRNEIDEILEECNGKISYDAISKMKYLDMVISESLRKWPPLPGIDRACVNSYTIKSTLPNESDARIDVGETLFVPIWGLHYDPLYFPNPDKFDPERFSDENKHNIKPYTYLPFGVGPRNCIGSRFALLEVKILFVNLLSKLELYPTEKTPIPMKLLKGVNNTASASGFWVGIKPRTN